MAQSGTTVKSTPVVRCDGIDHVVLYARDTAASAKFYTDVLGMEVKYQGADYVFLQCGNQRLALFRSGEDTQAGRDRELSHLAFTVPGTADAVRAALKVHGISVRGRRGDPDCIYFDDPDGYTLQIVATG